MKLIFISGQPGSGKTSVGKALVSKIKDSAYIGADSLVVTNPWELDDKTDALAIKNAVDLTNNFSEAGFENIVIAGLIRNQNLLDKFLSKLNQKADILFVWLRADKKTRKMRKQKRNRDEADGTRHFDFVDKFIPDIQSIKIKNGKSVFIDSTSKTIEEIIKEIQPFIS